MQTLGATELSRQLQKNIPSTSFLNKIKIAYRPYICPFDRLLALIPPHGKIFDIGCGSGMFLMLAAEFTRPAQLGGIEVSSELVQNATELLKSYQLPLDLQLYDGVTLPDSIKAYDLIFLIDVLHHISPTNQIPFLRNIYDKMGAGSKLVLKDIDGAQKLWSYFNKMHDFVFSGEVGNELPSGQVLQECRNIGFAVEAFSLQRMLVYPHYTMVLVK
jgi:cyclopropane fatty-acyl-phospholipid synthase-like methyltransferase